MIENLIIVRMFPPDLSYLQQVAIPLLDTIRMSAAGTGVGITAGFVAASLCSSKLNTCTALRRLLRGCIQIIRAVPVLILALAASFLFGTGTFAGTAALSLYTFAIMARLGYEDMDASPCGVFDALRLSGATRGKVFFRTVCPHVLPGYVINALYLFETNVRHAAILGYVGAGGIGLLLDEKLAWREYNKAGTVLLLLYCTVAVIEFAGEKFRHTVLNPAVAKKKNAVRRSRVFAWCVFGVVCISSILTITPPDITVAGKKIFAGMMRGFAQPDLHFLFNATKNGVPYLLFETVVIAVAGTVLGAIPAFFLSFAGSFSLMPRCIAVPARAILTAVRTVPLFVYALMCIRFSGPGWGAGILTVSFCSIGLLSKRFIIAIDDLDLRVWNAFAAAGIPFFARVKYAVVPQLVPRFSAALLYRFDVNLRDASVLGLAGAGGIGAPLIFAMNSYRWNESAAIIAGLVVLVLCVENLSAKIISRK